MNFVKVKLQNSQTTLGEKVRVLDGVLDRMRGLMGYKKVPEAEGVWLRPCNSIHTFFMRFSLDVIFLNSNNEIVAIIRNMKPWRLSRVYFSASSVLEFPAGFLKEELSVGEKVEALCIS